MNISRLSIAKKPMLQLGWCLLLGLTVCVAPLVSRAYDLSGQRWLSGSDVVMYLQLGDADKTLMDGSSSWDQVAESALGIWNDYLSGSVQFKAADATIPNALHDGKNSVFFSNTIYGQSFGGDTLGITLSYSSSSGIRSESDVIINTAKPFNSYRGPLRTNSSGGWLFDLRRVALHEFGHVLGLDHVDADTVSIMTPATSNIDTIQADDIAGVQAIYASLLLPPPVIAGGTSANGRVGVALSYQITATNKPASYAASGLPPGLSVNTVTGLISGIPMTAGSFNVAIKANNDMGTGTANVVLNIKAPAADAEPGLPVIALAASVPQVTAGTAAVGEFVLTRSGDDLTKELTVAYTVKGNAESGVDYRPLKGIKKMPPGKSSVKIKVVPLGGEINAGATRTVTLALTPGEGYSVGAAVKAKVRILDR